MARSSLRSFVPRLFVAALAVATVAPAQAEVTKRTFCVWDPVGAGGPVVSMMKDLKVKSLAWGVDLDLQAYTDEKIAAQDFKAEQCDAVLLTGVSVREFNSFAGTLGAVGAIPGMEEMRTLVTTLSQPQAAPLLREKGYEIGSILPIGSIFMFVRDGSLNSVEKLQGKKMAVLDNDPVAANMVRKVGGSVVPASLTSFSGLFNNGSVDIIFAPAVAYDTMELYKGIEGNGGVLDYPLLQGSMQIVFHWQKFPEDYGLKLRQYSLSRFDAMVETVRKAEAQIPEKYWIDINAEHEKSYDQMMRTSRISLRDDGLYDPRALQLMKKIRCKHEPTAGECTQSLE